MNSSTSNSKESPLFLLKTFALTSLILSVYAWGTRGVHFNPFTPQSQFQENQYKTEDFLQRTADINPADYSIFVGSSQSARLKEEYFSIPMINLSFGGGSAITGLEMILQMKMRFKRVIVDATILRPIDQKMLALLRNHLEEWRIKNLPVTNVERQPVSILSNWIRVKSGVTDEVFDLKQHDQWVEHQKEVFAFLAEKDRVQYLEYLDILKRQIAELKALGTPIYVVEVPMDPVVSSLPVIDYSIRMIKETFGSDPVLHWIHMPANPDLKTFDGIHLTPESAKIFAKQLETLK